MSPLFYLLCGLALFALGVRLLIDALQAHRVWGLLLGYSLTLSAFVLWAWSVWIAT